MYKLVMSVIIRLTEHVILNLQNSPDWKNHVEDSWAADVKHWLYGAIGFLPLQKLVLVHEAFFG